MDELDKKIIKLFNRTELREGEDVINNTDPAIAKELNIDTPYVSRVLAKYMNRKIEFLQRRIFLADLIN